MRDGEKRNAVKLDALEARVGVEYRIEEQVTALVGNQPDHHAPQEATNSSSPVHMLCRILLSSYRGVYRHERRNHHETEQ